MTSHLVSSDPGNILGIFLDTQGVWASIFAQWVDLLENWSTHYGPNRQWFGVALSIFA